MEMNRSITLEQCNRGLGMLEAGMAVSHVARNIGVSLCTISRFQKQINATGSFKDRPCTDRPRKTTAAILRQPHVVIASPHLRD